MHGKRILGAGFLALALLAVATSGCGDDESVTTTEAATTTQAVTTTEAASTTAAAEKTPVADADELMERVYTALNDMDNEAFRALVADDGVHSFYYVTGSTGSITDTAAYMEIDLPTAGFRGIEVLGEPIVSGNAVAVPVAYDYPEGVLTGFDLMVLVPTGHGWLLGGAATFVAIGNSQADAAQVQTLTEAESATWNGGDAEAVLALYGTDAMFWSDVTSPDSAYTGDALAHFVGGTVYDFDVEGTGEPVVSGPFAVVPNHLVTGVSDTSDGISLYWIQDGLIALHAFGQ